MGKNGATHASMAEHAARDQGARKRAIIVLTFVSAILAVIALGLESAVSTQKVGEERATHTSPPQRAARDERSDHFLFVSSGFLLKSLLPFVALRFRFALGT